MCTVRRCAMPRMQSPMASQDVCTLQSLLPHSRCMWVGKTTSFLSGVRGVRLASGHQCCGQLPRAPVCFVLASGQRLAAVQTTIENTCRMSPASPQACVVYVLRVGILHYINETHQRRLLDRLTGVSASTTSVPVAIAAMQARSPSFCGVM